MRALLAIVLLVSLAGCAPDAVAGTQRIEIEGRITEITASAGGRSYVLEVPGQGMLPLELADQRPPLEASGVVVEVPSDLDVPADSAGRFAALDAYVGETGDSLVVVAFLG